MEKQIDNTIIDKYYKLYDEKNYKTVFYSFSYSAIRSHFIEYEIYKYDERYGYLQNEEEIIRQFSGYISIIKNNDDKMKFIPFIVANEIYKELNDKNFFASIKDNIFNDFAVLNVRMNADKLHPHSYQKENFDTLEIDYNNKNFTAIHNFAIRSPMIYNYQYSKFMYFVSEKSSFDEYCEALDKKDTFSFLNLIELLDINQKIKILEKLSNNKTILEINILKQIVNTENNEQNIQNIILDFSRDEIIWKQFLCLYLRHPSQYPRLFVPLSNVLNTLELYKIDTFIQNIKIDRYSDDNRKLLLSKCTIAIEDNERRKYILEKVFLEWKTFIDSYVDCFGSIILTDVIDIVITYAKDFLSAETIKIDIVTIHHPKTTKEPKLHNKHYYDRTRSKRYLPSG